MSRAITFTVNRRFPPNTFVAQQQTLLIDEIFFSYSTVAPLKEEIARQLLETGNPAQIGDNFNGVPTAFTVPANQTSFGVIDALLNNRAI
jgi:hypothetical protein